MIAACSNDSNILDPAMGEAMGLRFCVILASLWLPRRWDGSGKFMEACYHIFFSKLTWLTSVCNSNLAESPREVETQDVQVRPLATPPFLAEGEAGGIAKQNGSSEPPGKSVKKLTAEYNFFMPFETQWSFFPHTGNLFSVFFWCCPVHLDLCFQLDHLGKSL